MHLNEGLGGERRGGELGNNEMTASLMLGGNQPIDPHTHTHTHKSGQLPPPPPRPLQTTERRRGAWTEKKKKTLHIFWVAAHYLAPCLQPAAQTMRGLAGKKQVGLRGAAPKPGWGWGSGLLWHHKVLLHILLWYVDHYVTFGIFDGKQMEFSRLWGT